jgi:hypothetical protein
MRLPYFWLVNGAHRINVPDVRALAGTNRCASATQSENRYCSMRSSSLYRRAVLWKRISLLGIPVLRLKNDDLRQIIIRTPSKTDFTFASGAKSAI